MHICMAFCDIALYGTDSTEAFCLSISKKEISVTVLEQSLTVLLGNFDISIFLSTEKEAIIL